MSEKIVNVDFNDEMGQSYIDYALSVITDRALPDVRDGLKPVQRRILYTLSDLTKSNQPHRKCARIVGDAMGKYHPHGDSSIYEGLVNMAQNWKMEIPLVDPHGNFGSVDGSGAAAMRYTEARISTYTEDACMKDLQYFKDTFVPNFDGTETEPTFLPFQVPNLLISGSSGIAVGMATNIPTHNLGEVVDALTAYMKNPDISTAELLDIMPGPDFATGGVINASKEELVNIYETGLGKLKVRGKVEVRELGYGRKSICVTEIPTTMIGSTANFLDKVADLVRNRELPAVVDIADRGDKNGECLCVDVKKGTSEDEIQNIINILYKKTGLEDTFGVNINCINDGKPEVMGLKRIFELYSAFKGELYETKYRKLLEAEEDVKEIKSGLIEAVDCIDLIIEILRGAKNTQDAKNCLINGDTSKIKFRFEGSEMDAKNLHFTEKQADAILAMRLQRLIGLEVLALRKELAEAEKNIKKYTALLKDKKKMLDQMISDMEEIKKKHAVPRRTHIEKFAEIKLKKAEVVAKDVAVLLDRFFYIKVIDDSVYVKNEEQIKKDYRHSFICGNTDRIVIFTDTGAMHTIKVADIIKQQAKKPTGKTAAKGKKDNGGLLGRLSDKGIQIFDFCNMQGNENIPFMCSIERNLDKMFVFATTDGMAKRVEAKQFDVSRKTISYGKDGERFVLVNSCEPTDFVVCKSVDGYYLRVSVDEIPTRGRSAGGVRLINLAEGDSLEFAYSGTIKDTFIQGETEVPFTKIKPAKRGNKGVKMRNI